MSRRVNPVSSGAARFERGGGLVEPVLDRREQAFVCPRLRDAQQRCHLLGQVVQLRWGHLV